jgi:cation diffusion facilitator CzcD-associated flavoprotein CzcO
MQFQNPDINPEVLIAGVGPTGLMMACQLVAYKVSFRILQKSMVYQY